MRVSLDDSVFDHIPRLAREMKWDEDRALGVLVRVYRSTQREKVAEENPARLVTICAMLFPDDDTAERFFTAMLAARLAVLLADGKLRIRGNQKRIEEQDSYVQGRRDAGRVGGLKTQHNRKNSIISEAQSSTGQAKSSTAKGSILILSNSEEGEGREQPPPPPNLQPEEPATTKAVTVQRVDATMLALHYGTYCRLLKDIRNRVAPPRPTKKAEWALQAIANAAGGEISAVLEAYIRDPNPYYAEPRISWSLEICERDLGQIYQRVKQPAVSSEAKAKQLAAHERAKQASVEQYERENGINTNRETAT